MDVAGQSADAFSISPVVENLAFDIANVSGGDRLIITGDFNFGTTYTFTLDTTLNTHYEQPLEFPLTSSFTTVPFRVEYGYAASRQHITDGFSIQRWRVR